MCMIGWKSFLLFIILFIIFLIPCSVADIGSDENFKIEKESGECWAILAGVDHYVFLQNNNLKYSWDDTFDMKNMLINDCKIEPDHLVFLYDGQATKSGIQTAISTLRSRVGPSDTVIFYFTGHGDQAEDIPPYDEYDDLDEYLCPQDSLPNLYSNDIRDDEIQIWLEQLNVKNIVCIFDICYAGGMVKSASSNYNDKFIDSDYEKDIKNRNFVVLMASNDYEESFSYDSIQNSAFTYYIVEGFKSPVIDKNHDYWISAEEVFSYAGLKTTEFTSSASNPQLFDGDTSNDVGIRFLGYPTTIPTTVPTTIPTTVPTTIPTFTITALAGQGGSISPSGSVQVSAGSSQAFTITPNTGYQVSNVIVDGINRGGISGYTFTNVQGSHTISATFSQIPPTQTTIPTPIPTVTPIPTSVHYIITATSGQGGIISPSGSVQVVEGSSQTFIITPNTGYKVSSVFVDGSNIGEANGYVFREVQRPHSIHATFSQLPQTQTTTIPTTVPSTIPTTVPTSIPTTGTTSPTPTPTSSNLKAEFVASPVSGSAPLRVQFKDSSQGNPSEWYWDINNDAFQDYSGSTIEHVYNEPGDYSIRLVVRNGQEINSVEKTNLIHVTDSEATGIQLYPGWNFISIPDTLEDGCNTAGYVFSGIESDQHSQFRYDTLSSAWVRIKPTDVITPCDGIWIYSVHSRTIQLKLEDNPENGLKQLYPGWNAIGISGGTPIPVKDALTNIRNQWSTVWGYDASSQQYDAAVINGGTGIHSDTQTLHPTKGYWVYMTGQGAL